MSLMIAQPNPLIMRAALRKLQVERQDAVIIGQHCKQFSIAFILLSATCNCAGDRMDTDILAGIQSEISTCLVLSGVTQLKEIKNVRVVFSC